MKIESFFYTLIHHCIAGRLILASYGNSRHLVVFDIPQCVLKNALLGIPKLENLNMFDNQIHSLLLPEGDVLENLITLNLDFNNLVELPEDMTRLKSLKTFQVSNNLITNIPQFICDMSLTELIVTPNPIIQPPLEDCERGIHGIRRYYCGLSRKDSKKLSSGKKKPDTFSNRKKNRSKKGTKSITHDHHSTSGLHPRTKPICRMASKPSILFSKHKEYPDSTGSLPSSDASIEELTAETDQMSIVGALAMPSTIAPSATWDTEDKDETDHQNSMKGLPEHIHEPAVERVFVAHLKSESYQVSTQTPSKDIVNDTLKIIFVGNAYAGKTTIIKRLKEGRKATPPKVQERTIGVNIYEWDPGVECAMHDIATSNFDTHVIQENESTSAPIDVKFSIWDFAGQNEYLVCKLFMSYVFTIFRHYFCLLFFNINICMFRFPSTGIT